MPPDGLKLLGSVKDYVKQGFQCGTREDPLYSEVEEDVHWFMAYLHIIQNPG